MSSPRDKTLLDAVVVMTDACRALGALACLAASSYQGTISADGDADTAIVLADVQERLHDVEVAWRKNVVEAPPRRLRLVEG